MAVEVAAAQVLQVTAVEAEVAVHRRTVAEVHPQAAVHIQVEVVRVVAAVALVVVHEVQVVPVALVEEDKFLINIKKKFA